MTIVPSRPTPWLAVAAALSFATARLPAAETVIGFRNGGTGAWPDADPPLEWSVTKNVAWRWDAPLLGMTISSPLIVGDRIVTLAQPLTIVCLDKRTGRELWRRERHLERARGDGDRAFAIHAAIRRDYRIRELRLRTGTPAPRKKGAVKPVFSLTREIRGYTGKLQGKEKGLKPHRYSAENQAFFAGRLEMLEGIIADGKANAAAYTAELAKLLATVPSDAKAIRATSYLCASSPASDGERIYAVFSPGLLVCYDLAGTFRWAHAIVDDRGGLAERNWGSYAKVPVVAGGKVVAAMGDQVHCLDAATGRVVWQVRDEEAVCGGSPIIGTAGGRHYVGLGSGVVLDIEDGRGLFRAESVGIYAQNAVSADRRTFHYLRCALALEDDRARPVRVLWTLPDANLLDKTDKKTGAWIFGGGHQYCAAAVHDGIVYYYNTHYDTRFSAVDAEIGAVIYGPVKKIGDDTYSDLVLAGDHLFSFQTGYAGQCLVFKAGRSYKLVGENRLESLTWNVPVFEGTRMYVRTHLGLFCFEKPR